MLDFDDIDDWAPQLAAALSSHVPDSVERKLVAARLEYIEDARDLLFELTDRELIVDATLSWIRSTTIAGFHGTRLTDAEVDSIRVDGLVPLKAEDRRHRLARALSLHSKWRGVADRLDAAIQVHCQGARAGRREHQVHLTLSRAGLMNRFSHYLKYGSEFDQRVTQALLGSEGMQFLAHDGKARMIQVAVPGTHALDAAHWISSIDSVRTGGDIPNLVDEFLKSWSYRFAHPRFRPCSLRVDCGMVFRSAVLPTWIVDIDTLAD